jgi:hypothetical protein
MKAGVCAKPDCDEYTAGFGLPVREIFLTAKPGVVAPYPKQVRICHTLAVAKDQWIWGCVLSGDLTDYTMDEQPRKSWSPRTRCDAAWPQE